MPHFFPAHISLTFAPLKNLPALKTSFGTKLIFTLLTVFAFASANAQSWLWAKKFVNADASGDAVATDAAGNIYMACSGGGYGNTHLRKYDPAGNVIWTRSYGNNSTTCSDAILTVCTDKWGHVFIAGRYCDYSFKSLDNNIQLLQGYAGSFNPFVGMLDSSGNLLWMKTANLNNCTDVINSIVADTLGNCYAVGSFTSLSIVWGNDTLNNGGLGFHPSGSNNCSFVMKFDSSGNVGWSKRIYGRDNVKAKSLSIDVAGNLYLAGSFDAPTITFDSITLANTGYYDAFIAKYSSNGDVLWAKKAGGIYTDEANALVCHPDGSLYVTGYIESPTASFGTLSIPNPKYSMSQRTAMFITKYDSSGNAVWARTAYSLTGGSKDDGFSLACYNGGVYVSGKIGGSSMVLGTYTLTPTGNVYDPLFVANYSAAGDVGYATWLQGGASTNNAICTDNNFSLYLTSYFSSSIDTFHVGSTSLTPAAIQNAFLARLSLPTLMPVELTGFAVAPVGKALYVRWHTAQEQAIKGYTVERATSARGSFAPVTFASSKRGVQNAYDYADINVQSGTRYFYRLSIVENDGSVKYSAIQDGMLPANGISTLWFNNPVNDILTVRFSKPQPVQLTLLNNSGQEVIKRNMLTGAANATIDVSHLPRGAYWLRATMAAGVVMKLVVKD